MILSFYHAYVKLSRGEGDESAIMLKLAYGVQVGYEFLLR